MNRLLGFIPGPYHSILNPFPKVEESLLNVTCKSLQLRTRSGPPSAKGLSVSAITSMESIPMQPLIESKTCKTYCPGVETKGLTVSLFKLVIPGPVQKKLRLPKVSSLAGLRFTECTVQVSF